MPIYTFRCPAGHVVEEIRPIKEIDGPMPCVECNEKDGSIVEMTRQISSASVRVLGGTPTFYPGRGHK